MNGPLPGATASVLENCLAVVLAGGQGRRMGGQDKGLLPWGSTTLAQHAARRMSAAGLPVRISANRHLDTYRQMGFPLLSDRRAGFQGPLAAIESALHAAPQGWVLAVPCDSPFFPQQLPQRLAEGVGPRQDGMAAPAAFALCGPHVHPVFCLVATGLADGLSRFIDAGGRRVTEWLDAIQARAVDFGAACEADFANANTPEDYAALRSRHTPEPPHAC